MGERIFLQGQELFLLPEKAVYWPDENLLLISDVHLGKISHFRNAGIAVPAIARLENFTRLQQLFDRYRPERVIFLGDLFHSRKNLEWAEFSSLIARYSNMRFELVLGNHDILHTQDYISANLSLHQHALIIGPFVLSHQPLSEYDGYNIYGHLHPGIKLKGSARQSMKLPCFYFGKEFAVMPAFGNFTGLHIMNMEKGQHIYAIAESRLIKIL